MATIITFPLARRQGQPAPSLVVGNTVLRFPGADLVPVPEPEPAPKRERGKKDAAKEAAHRKDMLAKVHIALSGNKKNGTPGLYETLPGFTEDAYRFVLRERWGVNSAADMTKDQLHGLLLYLKSLGANFKSRRNRKMLSHEDRVDRIRELLAEKARRDGGDGPAWGYAVSILKRETRGEVTSIDKATPQQLDAVIAALSRNARYAERKGRQ